jgi:hypothetical protein
MAGSRATQPPVFLLDTIANLLLLFRGKFCRVFVRHACPPACLHLIPVVISDVAAKGYCAALRSWKVQHLEHLTEYPSMTETFIEFR